MNAALKLKQSQYYHFEVKLYKRNSYIFKELMSYANVGYLGVKMTLQRGSIVQCYICNNDFLRNCIIDSSSLQ